MASHYLSLLIVSILILSISHFSNGGLTSSYIRSSTYSTDIPLSVLSPPQGFNAPEQVHITQGDYVGKAMIISWVTPLKPGDRFVRYWKADDPKDVCRVHGSVKKYRFVDYTSGYIHHATIDNLEYDTKYFYEVGGAPVARQFYFTTPPAVGPDVPYTFGIIGDLGQTYDSNQTLEHYNSNTKGQAVLYVGDLSYADHYKNHDNNRWDSWARLVEKNVAYQPWIWTAGNHELDYLPDNGEPIPFKPFMHRYHTPYKASKSTSPLWYSVKRASAHIIVLSSYSAYGKYTPQYEWLQKELTKVNREETPWLIVLVHSPWYNSVNYHYMEGETMRVQFESWFVQNKVDLVLAGHVHAYERSHRISNIAYNITDGRCKPVMDPSAPMYINLGDGGNIEGLANSFVNPQPDYSAFRESSFGHGMLEIKNRTHAHYSWHRNQDSEPVVGDSLWVHNRYFYPYEETSV